ncbi:MAG: hypothetical protein GX963_04380 [Bacteroidales bacterium]|nr:hypothetical protein [Bacteroidales bacterium]
MNNRRYGAFIIISFLLCFASVQIKAQNEKEALENISHEVDEATKFHLKFDSYSSIPLYLNLKDYKVFLSPYQNFMIYSPFALDYNKRSTFQLDQKLFLTFYSTRELNIGLADVQNKGFDFKILTEGGFSIEAGVFYSLQRGFLIRKSINKDYGYRLRINYDLTNQLQLSIYGQYLVKGNEDFFLNFMNVIPKTHIGTSIDYKSGNKDIGMKMEYQYDKNKKEWKPEVKGKVTIGF